MEVDDGRPGDPGFDLGDDDETGSAALERARVAGTVAGSAGGGGMREDDERDRASGVRGVGANRRVDAALDAASDVSGDRPARQLASHYFAGWDAMRDSLVPPDGRKTLAPDLYGVCAASHGYWRDVRYTSLCGSGPHDLLFVDPYEFDLEATHAEMEANGTSLKETLRGNGIKHGKGDEFMPPGVRQERAVGWFDKRLRHQSQGVDSLPSLRARNSAITRAGLPRGSMVMNIASCLRRHGGRGLLDLAYSQAHGCDPSIAKRALATATMVSAMCQPMEMGFQSGDYAELQAWNDEMRAREEVEEARAAAEDAQAGDDAASSAGGRGRKRQKKEAPQPPEIRKHTYFCKGRSHGSNSIGGEDTDGERRKFIYVLERLVDEESEHLTHGHRLHVVVYDPKFSNTQLLSRLMETARKIT